MFSPPQRPGGLRLGLVVVFYGLMLGGAWCWARWQEGPGLFAQTPGRLPPLSAAAAGLGLGLATVAASAWLIRRWLPMRQLALRLGGLLGPLGTPTITVLALCSAIAEEALFRGAMQPAWGLVVSSLLFGAAHLGPDRRFLPWTLFAALLGFALGGLQLLGGSLLAPILAHFTINFFNLHEIDRLGRQAVEGEQGRD